MAKILIIEDDLSIIDLVSLRLSEAGHVMCRAMDGISGPMVASRERPNLIILDYDLPGADGAKVHERLRGNTFTADTPVIFLTATPVNDIITRIRNDDRTRFLQKPVDFGLLAKTMSALLPLAQRPEEPVEDKLPAQPVERYDPDDPNSTCGGEVIDLD